MVGLWGQTGRSKRLKLDPRVLNWTALKTKREWSSKVDEREKKIGRSKGTKLLLHIFQASTRTHLDRLLSYFWAAHIQASITIDLPL